MRTVIAIVMALAGCAEVPVESTSTQEASGWCRSTPTWCDPLHDPLNYCALQCGTLNAYCPPYTDMEMLACATTHDPTKCDCDYECAPNWMHACELGVRP